MALTSGTLPDGGASIAGSAKRLFAAHAGKDVIRAAEDGVFPQALWDDVAAAGFTAALPPEHAGGATAAEAMTLLRIAAHAAPIPLAVTMLRATSTASSIG